MIEGEDKDDDRIVADPEREARRLDGDRAFRRQLLGLPPSPPIASCPLCRAEAQLQKDLADGALYRCSSCTTTFVKSYPENR